MYLEIETPESPLSGIIESIIYYRGYTAAARYELLLPDGGAQLVVALDEVPRAVLTLDGWRRLTGAWFTGVQTRPLPYLGECDATTVGIRFSPSGFYAE